jgi:TPR repeat protein
MHKELMKLTIRIGMLLLSGSMVFAQNPLKEVVKMGFSDVAATKQRAEAGDAQAQLSLANTLSFNFKKAESLLWYRKAAEQNVVEAKSRLGEMLLFGDAGIPANQSVKANPSEGIR